MSQIDMFTGKTAIEQARDETQAAARDGGCECPVCDQFVKVYRHSISATVLKTFVDAFNAHGMNYFHIDYINKLNPKNGGSFAKLRHWNLIQELPKDPQDKSKRTSGQWKITSNGYDFIMNIYQIPKYALLYNGRCLGFEGDMLSIGDVTDKFSLDELMNR